MKTRVLLFALFAITLFALGTTITLLFNATPISTDIIMLFYASLFVTLFGIFFFAAFAWTFMRLGSVPPWQRTLVIGRWSLLLALFLTLSLVLRSYRLWNLATGIALLAGFIITDLMWRRRASIKS